MNHTRNFRDQLAPLCSFVAHPSVSDPSDIHDNYLQLYGLAEAAITYAESLESRRQADVEFRAGLAAHASCDCGEEVDRVA